MIHTGCKALVTALPTAEPALPTKQPGSSHAQSVDAQSVENIPVILISRVIEECAALLYYARGEMLTCGRNTQILFLNYFRKVSCAPGQHLRIKLEYRTSRKLVCRISGQWIHGVNETER